MSWTGGGGGGGLCDHRPETTRRVSEVFGGVRSLRALREPTILTCLGLSCFPCCQPPARATSQAQPQALSPPHGTRSGPRPSEKFPGRRATTPASPDVRPAEWRKTASEGGDNHGRCQQARPTMSIPCSRFPCVDTNGSRFAGLLRGMSEPAAVPELAGARPLNRHRGCRLCWRQGIRQVGRHIRAPPLWAPLLPAVTEASRGIGELPALTQRPHGACPPSGGKTLKDAASQPERGAHQQTICVRKRGPKQTVIYNVRNSPSWFPK